MNSLSSIQKRINNIESLLDTKEQIPARYLNDDLSSILRSIFESTRRLVDLKELEARFERSIRLDFDFASKSLIALKPKLPNKKVTIWKNTTVNPRRIADELVKDIAALKSKVAKLDPMSIAIEIDLEFDHKFFFLLAALNKLDSIPKELSNALSKKIKLLDKKSLYELWSKIQEMFLGRHDHLTLPQYEDIVHDKFFETSQDRSEIEKKLVSFYTKIKPLSVLKFLAQGGDRYPVGEAGVIRLFLIRESNGLDVVTESEFSLSQAMSRLIAFWEKFGLGELFGKTTELLDAAQLPDDSRIAIGPDYKNALEYFNKNCNIRMALYEAKNALCALESVVSFEQPIEKLLRAYKLGLEVRLPKIAEQIIDRNEIEHQQDLATFLIHNGIFAIGTQFGYSRTDFFIDSNYGRHVIETKVFKKEFTSYSRKNKKCFATVAKICGSTYARKGNTGTF